MNLHAPIEADAGRELIGLPALAKLAFDGCDLAPVWKSWCRASQERPERRGRADGSFDHRAAAGAAGRPPRLAGHGAEAQAVCFTSRRRWPGQAAASTGADGAGRFHGQHPDRVHAGRRRASRSTCSISSRTGRYRRCPRTTWRWWRSPNPEHEPALLPPAAT